MPRIPDSTASGSFAAAVAAFPRGPRIAFAPEGGSAAEFKAVTDEVKSFAEGAVAEFKALRQATEAGQRGLDAADTRMSAIEQKMARRGGGGAPAAAPSLGQALIDGDEFKSLMATSGRRGMVRVQSTRDALETKNLTTVAGSGGASCRRTTVPTR